MKIKVAVVDDQRLFRKGMVELLKSYEELEVVAEAENGREFITLLQDTEVLPDVVLLDLNMPELDGIETTKILQGAFKSIGIIILSVHNEEKFITHLIELGAKGYLLKNAEPEEVSSAISSVHQNGFYINQGVMRAMRNALRNREQREELIIQNRFTGRELEVLELICRENTTVEIAAKLFLSVKTVNGHRDNLLRKAGVRNTAGLVVYALKKQLISLN